MEWLTDIDWRNMLVPGVSPIEIFLRGTLTYLAIFALLRVVLKRESAGLGISDLLVVVLIADAAANSMSGDYRAVPDGLLLVAVIVGWAYALDWLAYRFPWFAKVSKPPKLPLIENGRLRLDNMRRELVTRDELASQLRENGIDDFGRVRVAYMEPNGRITALTNE